MSIDPELVLYNYSLASHTTIATNMTRTFPKKKKKKKKKRVEFTRA